MSGATVVLIVYALGFAATFVGVCRYADTDFRDFLDFSLFAFLAFGTAMIWPPVVVLALVWMIVQRRVKR